eukprot:scaffold30392_cov44-Prasinocladus_malaysianus.AAC.1
MRSTDGRGFSGSGSEQMGAVGPKSGPSTYWLKSERVPSGMRTSTIACNVTHGAGWHGLEGVAVVVTVLLELVHALPGGALAAVGAEALLVPDELGVDLARTGTGGTEHGVLAGIRAGLLPGHVALIADAACALDVNAALEGVAGAGEHALLLDAVGAVDDVNALGAARTSVGEVVELVHTGREQRLAVVLGRNVDPATGERRVNLAGHGLLGGRRRA